MANNITNEDTTELKSTQELLNMLCSCIVVDDNGQSFIRTKANSETTPKSDTKSSSESEK